MSCEGCTQGWSSTSSLPSLMIAAVQVTNARFPLRLEPQARAKVRSGVHTQRRHGGHHLTELILF